MKITLFTGNQARHLGFVQSLSRLASELWVVQETKTSFAGRRDAIHKAHPIVEDYFRRVMSAESEVFDCDHFSPKNVRTMSLFMGDLSFYDLGVFREALNSDIYIVFGSSYIRGALAEFLVNARCINVHMGLSPYYRGSACNFWAMYDRRPWMVGATIHLLSLGLDSGPILFHALPEPMECDGFALGMYAVRAAQIALCNKIEDGSIYTLTSQSQDKNLELRYTRSSDFTVDVVSEYINRLMTPVEIFGALSTERSKLALKSPSYL